MSTESIDHIHHPHRGFWEEFFEILTDPAHITIEILSEIVSYLVVLGIVATIPRARKAYRKVFANGNST